MRTRKLLSALAALALTASLAQPALAATHHKKHRVHHTRHKGKAMSKRPVQHGQREAPKASPAQAKPGT